MWFSLSMYPIIALPHNIQSIPLQLPKTPHLKSAYLSFFAALSFCLALYFALLLRSLSAHLLHLVTKLPWLEINSSIGFSLPHFAQVRVLSVISTGFVNFCFIASSQSLHVSLYLRRPLNCSWIANCSAGNSLLHLRHVSAGAGCSACCRCGKFLP